MSNIDKQWLQQKIAEKEASRDDIPFGLDEDDSKTLAALRIALASLEAEAVAYTDAEELRFHHATNDMWPVPLGHGMDLPLYAAPPAPVSAPEKLPCDLENEWSLVDAANKNNSIPGEKVKGDDFEINGPLSCYQAGKIDGWNEYRTAMLQVAKPVTTAYKLPFEQWLSQQTGTIDVECGCVMTEVFFHWLRVAYEAGNSPVIPEGWVMLPAEPTQAMMNAWLSEVANWRGHAAGYRAMLAAAPQQEMK